MGANGDAVDISIRAVADEASAQKAAKDISDALNKELKLKKEIDNLSDKEYQSEKALSKIKRSDTQLIARQAKLESQKEALKHDRSKSAKDERDSITEQIKLIQAKRTQNTLTRLDEQKNLANIKSEIAARKELLGVATGGTEGSARIIQRTDKDLKALESTQSAVASLKEAFNEMDASSANNLSNTRANIKKTAAELKSEIQGIISTFEQQPSKDFTKAENENIKNLQNRIAKLRVDAKTAAEQLEGPWKMQVDVRGMQDDLSAVTKEVDTQKAEVAKLEQAYNDAKARASEVVNAFQPGEYSAEQLTLEMEKIKGAEQDATRAGRAYEDAKSKLDGLIQRQVALENEIETTTDKYKQMVDALKSDDHNAPKVEKNESLMAQFESANAEADALQKELEEVYNTANSNNIMKKEDLEVAKQIEETLKGIGNEVKNIQNSGTLFDTTEKERAQAEAKKAQEAQTKAQIRELNQEGAAIKRSTAEYYYKLRAVKMLGFVMNNITKKANAFGRASFNAAKKSLQAYLKLIPGVSALGRAFDKARVSQNKFHRETKAGIKANAGFNLSIKELIKNILKYGLGIRSVYVLLNKMRSAVTDGMGQLAMGYDEVNRSMSSIVTSMNQIKAAITTIVEPLIHVLAPILEKISALVSDIAYKVASFIAALTGQSVVFKATRNQIDYAASLDKTAKSAKDAKKELSGLDKLNVLHSKEDNDSGADAGAMGFEKVPIDTVMADWAKKFKDFLDRLFGPIKKAWEKWGAWVKASFKKMLDELLGLGKVIARDFWRVWEEPETQKIFENIFHILGDMALIVANLAINFRNAWTHNENGYRILKAIRDIILIITDSLVRMADYTVEWSKHLNFTPLLDAIADTLEQKIVPAVEKIMGLVETLYEQILLNIIKKFIENGLPRLVNMFGKIADIIGIIADRLNFALKSGSNGINIINKISDLLEIVADHIDSALDKTKEWAENLDFRPLLISIKGFLEDIKPAVDAIAYAIEHLWTDVLLPFWSYIIEDGGPRLLDLLGQIFGEYNEETGLGIKWENFKATLDELLPTLEKFLKLGWEVLLQIIEDLGKAFDDFVNSGALDTLVQKFKDWVENADPEEIATKIETFAKILIGAIGALNLFNSVILPLITNFMTFQNLLNNMAMTSKLKDIKTAVEALSGTGAGGAGGIAGLVKALGSIALPVGIVIASLALIIGAFGGVEETIAAVKEKFDELVKYLKDFAERTGLSESFDKLKEKFSGLSESLTELRPIFETVLDIITAIAEFIGGEVIAILDGLSTSIGGVIDYFTGLFEVISGIVKILTGDFKGGITDISNGLGKEFQGIIETVTGLFEFWGDSVANIADVIFPGAGEAISKFVDDTKLAIETWVNDVLGFFKNLKHDLIGDPIVYDIRDGIISGFGEWIAQTASDVGGWVKDRVTDFTALASDIGTSVVNMKDDVVNKFNELKDGASEKAGQFVTTAEEKFNSVREKAQTNFESNKFVVFGKNAIKGLESGIKQIGAVISASSKGANDIKNRFRTGLSVSEFRSFGANVINALASGLSSGLNSALSTVSNICSQITSRVKSAFQIHSPSRVFADIGENLMLGLVKGVDDNSDEVDKSFEDIIPSDEMLDNFYNKFISMITELTTEVTNMFDAMAAHIDTVIENLGKLSALQNFESQFANISKMRLPDIAVGYKLPSNTEFRKDKSTEIDLSDLPNIIKNAVIEAITNTADLQTDDETIMINIDGKNIFQVVRNENSKYKKQHGTSAF